MSHNQITDNDETPKRKPPSWIKKGNASSQEFKDRHAKGSESSRGEFEFSKFLEGVVFVLSGFVNPERSVLRSQALEMGGEYRPDWSSECTLLVCAFPNTPKFRQVESDCGTIVSKEWISECYNQKKLVEIDQYLMHAGKPWRKRGKHPETSQVQKNAQPEEPQKQVERKVTAKLSVPASFKDGLSDTVKDQFSPSKIRDWAVDDFRETLLWLESQEERPEVNEIKMIAAQGVTTCLQDAIESLKQNDDIQLVTEQWKFVPRVVKELAKLEGGKSKKGSISKEELIKLAISCKKIYEEELGEVNGSPTKSKKQKPDGDEETQTDDAGFDSDETIEMTEEEIELACRQLSSEPCLW